MTQFRAFGHSILSPLPVLIGFVLGSGGAFAAPAASLLAPGGLGTGVAVTPAAISGGATSGVTVPGATTPGTTVTGARIAPHRAVYTVAMATARNSSKVTSVRGRMTFEWAEACDGWLVEQRYQLRFFYAEGDETQMTSSYATWEAKNNQKYRFNVRKYVNGQLEEDIKGEARLGREGGDGTAHFSRPEERDYVLSPGTQFPTRHTISLIEKAQSGAKLYNQMVFDGSDTNGATEINAVIVPATPAKPPVLAKTPLVRDRGWQVRLAFFPVDSDEATPEYEMGMLLLDNGVAESMLIDYGDFTVNAVLETLEPLPRPNC